MESPRYQSAASLARFAKLAIFGTAATDLLVTGATFLEVSALGMPIEQAPLGSPMADAVGLGMCFSGVGLLGMFILSAVLFPMWVHRTHKNATALGATLSQTPGYAAGVWFIPFANLWQPLEVIRGLDAASLREEDDDGWASAVVSGDLTVWWVCWIGANVLSTIESRMHETLFGPAAIVLTGLSSILLVTAAVLLGRIIDRIQSQLDAKARRLDPGVAATAPLTF